ncbi:GMC oxidoreductase [Amniculicola lignicola CBS 123094]|uniref:GMC oxidoreductase n=1 Tax=Amniculicola lignicola CBS 123094 TaxID=1392246 RepID=A0A6A5VTL6_9PLEO|nr:GMC oxidoreductase [Amniculicola lignicola CBS 123094]
MAISKPTRVGVAAAVLWFWLCLFALPVTADNEAAYAGKSATAIRIPQNDSNTCNTVIGGVARVAAVVEAGGFYEQDNGNLCTIPGNALNIPFLDTTPSYPRNPLMDWDYFSVPLTQAGNRVIHYAATAGAYDNWAALVGDSSYTRPNVLPFFKKSATLTAPDFSKRNTPNATFSYDTSVWNNALRGPLQVFWASWQDPTITWLAKGIRSLGLAMRKIGFNSGSLTGSSAYVTTTVRTRDATRSYSRTSYMDTIGVPSGLKVYHHTATRKIPFKGKKASEVVVEIILSAGVFGSPHLLLVSGVGPAATLNPLGIPVVSNLAGAAWGPLSSISAYTSFGKIPTSMRKAFSCATTTALSWFPFDRPEVEYIAEAVALGNATLGLMSSCLTALLSRGSVTIKSADPRVPPVINLGWFTNPADGGVAVAGLKRAREAWSNISSIIVSEEIAPGAAVRSDAQSLQYIKNSATQIWHAGATCSMGKKGDAKAVVNSEAQVFGVSALRVVDASAFPFMVPGHPQATVYMFAESIADAIIRGK